jgi:hypothetical protein
MILNHWEIKVPSQHSSFGPTETYFKYNSRPFKKWAKNNKTTST